MKRPIEWSFENGTPKTTLVDRRFFPRIQLQAQGCFQHALEPCFPCTIMDVSSGGAQVSLDLSASSRLTPTVTQGEFVRLDFTIGRRYELSATVIWVQQRYRQSVIGVEWSVTDEEVLNRLELEIARIIVNRRRLGKRTP